MTLEDAKLLMGLQATCQAAFMKGSLDNSCIEDNNKELNSLAERLHRLDELERAEPKSDAAQDGRNLIETDLQRLRRVAELMREVGSLELSNAVLGRFNLEH